PPRRSSDLDQSLYLAPQGSTDSPNSGGVGIPGDGDPDDPGNPDTPGNSGGPNSGNPPQGGGGGTGTQAGPVNLLLMDMPLLAYPNNPYGPYIASSADPWHGATIYRSPTTSGYTLDTNIIARSPMGTLLKVYDLNTDTGSGPSELAALGPGPYGVVDRRHMLEVSFTISPNIQTISWDEFFGSVQNIIALRNPDYDNEWEIIQFRQVDLVSGNTFRLRDLIRG